MNIETTCREELATITSSLTRRMADARGPLELGELAVQLGRLSSVRFEVSSRLTSTAGQAYFRGPRQGLVKISRSIFSNPANEDGGQNLRNTIRHELAHIAAPDDAKHGPVWKKIAKSFGCTAERCHSLKVERRAEMKAYPVACECCRKPLGTLNRRARPTVYLRNRRSQCCRAALVIV